MVLSVFYKDNFFSVFLFQLRCSQKSHTIQNQTINQFHHRTIGFSISIRITCIRSSHTSHNSITLFICLLGCCAYHTFSNINVVGNKQKKHHWNILRFYFTVSPTNAHALILVLYINKKQNIFLSMLIQSTLQYTLK